MICPVSDHRTPVMLATTRNVFRSFFSKTESPPRRSLLEFARDEFVIPKGEYKGWRWSEHTQPFVKLAYQAIDSGKWPRRVITGCVQSGKSLNFWVLPVLHTLFELGETYICGAPTILVGKDKWLNELQPAIKASRYRELLPSFADRDDGFREEIRFRNDAVLKWMGGAGGDEHRSSYTSANVGITEVDKMDKAGKASRETDPVSQIEARANSIPLRRRRIWLECTVSHAEGRIWLEWLASTQSTVICPCVHCGKHVLPSKEHLQSWQKAQTEVEAFRDAYFECPECHGRIDDVARKAMNSAGVLVHKGQTVTDSGEIVGDPPETFTFGFRWTAWHNQFWTIGEIAREAWKAQRATDNVEVGRQYAQFVWAEPWVPANVSLTRLDAAETSRRQAGVRRGIVPQWAEVVTAGLDVGDHWIHWTVTAWSKTGRGAIIDYGKFAVPEDPDKERGIFDTLKRSIEKWQKDRWICEDGTSKPVHLALIDAGWRGHVIRRVCSEFGNKQFYPLLGRGYGQHMAGKYSQSTSSGNLITHRGLEYHWKFLAGERIDEVELNCDYWKSLAIRRLQTSLESRGPVVLFDAEPHEHEEYLRHLTAEVEKEVFDQKKNRVVTVWERVRRQNHWLDTYTYACAAAHYCEVRWVENPEQSQPPQQAQDEPSPIPDVPLNHRGMPYLLTDR